MTDKTNEPTFGANTTKAMKTAAADMARAYKEMGESELKRHAHSAWAATFKGLVDKKLNDFDINDKKHVAAVAKLAFPGDGADKTRRSEMALIARRYKFVEAVDGILPKLQENCTEGNKVPRYGQLRLDALRRLGDSAGVIVDEAKGTIDADKLISAVMVAKAKNAEKREAAIPKAQTIGNAIKHAVGDAAEAMGHHGITTKSLHNDLATIEKAMGRITKAIEVKEDIEREKNAKGAKKGNATDATAKVDPAVVLASFGVSTIHELSPQQKAVYRASTKAAA